MSVQAPAAPARLAPGVELLPTLERGAGERLVELPDGRMTRVGADLGRLLDALAAADGNVTPSTLAATLGRPWTAGIVGSALRRLGEMGITELPTATRRPSRSRRPARLAYRAPLSLQLTLLHPDRLMRPGAAWLRALTGRRATTAALATMLAGLPALGAALASDGPLREPAALSTYLLVLAAVLATVSLHELAHGAVLAAHGGRPRRIGVMIFYLLPAAFCDVSDVWRLSPPARVRVALAGIVTQGAAGGVAAIAALPATGSLEQGLAFYAVLTYGYGLVNLIPFLKLDGYVALTGGLDIPNLRAKAMEDFQDALAHRLLGARRAPRRLRRRWGLAFGAACTLAPAFVLLSAAATLAPAILPIGAAGALAALALAVLLAVLLVHALVRFLRRCVRNGARPVRTGLVLGAAGFAVAAALTTVEVPGTAHGGYATVDGRPTLVLGLGASARDLRSGDRVDVARNGLLAGARVGEATIAGEPRGCDAPLSAIVPVRAPGRTLRAQCLALRGTSGLPVEGRVTARLPDAPLGERIAGLLVTPALDALGVGGR